jgi:DNA polymerase II small subunit/DNA polymerase delta subunit B
MAGQPRKLESPEKLLQLWEEYKAFVDSNPDVIQEVTPRGIVERQVKKPYLKQGFEVFVYNKMKYHVGQFLDNQGGLYNEYIDIVKHIRSEWQLDQLSGTLTGRYKAPNLIAKMHGMVSQQEVKVVGEKEIFKSLDLDVPKDDSAK